MGACELCGAEKVATRQVTMGRAKIGACGRCIDKMGLQEDVKPAPKPFSASAEGNKKFSGGYGGQGRSRKDIMHRGEKELAPDFAKRITSARVERGWDKRELAHKLAEKVNVIQSAEGGKRPTDAFIKKIERFLDIELLIDAQPDENRMVGVGDSRGMTLGDFLKGNK